MKKFLFIFGLCMALVGCGCRYDKVRFHIDPSLPCFQKIQTHEKIRESDGSIIANISGIPKSDAILFYRVVWFDENDMPMNTLLSKWHKVTVLRDMPFNWTVVAPSSKAKRYKVYVSDRWIDEKLTY